MVYAYALTPPPPGVFDASGVTTIPASAHELLATLRLASSSSRRPFSGKRSTSCPPSSCLEAPQSIPHAMLIAFSTVVPTLSQAELVPAYEALLANLATLGRPQPFDTDMFGSFGAWQGHAVLDWLRSEPSAETACEVKTQSLLRADAPWFQPSHLREKDGQVLTVKIVSDEVPVNSLPISGWLGDSAIPQVDIKACDPIACGDDENEGIKVVHNQNDDHALPAEPHLATSFGWQQVSLPKSFKPSRAKSAPPVSGLSLYNCSVGNKYHDLTNEADTGDDELVNDLIHDGVISDEAAIDSDPGCLREHDGCEACSHSDLEGSLQQDDDDGPTVATEFSWEKPKFFSARAARVLSAPPSFLHRTVWADLTTLDSDCENDEDDHGRDYCAESLSVTSERKVMHDQILHDHATSPAEQPVTVAEPVKTKAFYMSNRIVPIPRKTTAIADSCIDDDLQFFHRNPFIGQEQVQVEQSNSAATNEAEHDQGQSATDQSEPATNHSDLFSSVSGPPDRRCFSDRSDLFSQCSSLRPTAGSPARRLARPTGSVCLVSGSTAVPSMLDHLPVSSPGALGTNGGPDKGPIHDDDDDDGGRAKEIDTLQNAMSNSSLQQENHEDHNVHNKSNIHDLGPGSHRGGPLRPCTGPDDDDDDELCIDTDGTLQKAMSDSSLQQGIKLHLVEPGSHGGGPMRPCMGPNIVPRMLDHLHLANSVLPKSCKFSFTMKKDWCACVPVSCSSRCSLKGHDLTRYQRDVAKIWETYGSTAASIAAAEAFLEKLKVRDNLCDEGQGPGTSQLIGLCPATMPGIGCKQETNDGSISNSCAAGKDDAAAGRRHINIITPHHQAKIQRNLSATQRLLSSCKGGKHRKHRKSSRAPMLGIPRNANGKHTIS